MRLILVGLLFSLLAVSSWAEPDPAPKAEPQYYQFGYPAEYSYFRSAAAPAAAVYPSNTFPSMVDTANPLYGQPRFFFATITLTLSTVTSTATATSTTTCTTSTAALTTCSPGRRRRGVMLADNKMMGRGLFFNENDDLDNGNVFLPSLEKPAQPEAVVEDEHSRTTRQLPTVPVYIQPGFTSGVPDGMRSGRFLLAFATSTVTTTSTKTTTSVLTAVCSSTTGYNACA